MALQTKKPNIKAFGEKLGDFFERRPAESTAIIAFIVTLLIESVSRHSPVGGVVFMVTHPIAFLTNMAMVATATSLGNFFKKRTFFVTFFSGFCLVMGIANGIVLAFRVTPLGIIDISMLPSVFPAIGVYLEVWQIILIAVLLVAAIVGLVVLSIRTKKRHVNFKLATIVLISSLLLSLGFYSVTVVGHREEREAEFSNIAGAYSRYGFVYCFMTGAIDTGIDKPEFYSKAAVNWLVGNLDEEEDAGSFRPNIIMVQLESFFDVKYLDDVQYEGNPIPNFTRLKENYSTGFLRVPSVGAGTANTEFEVLSGMSLDFFGMGEYPYKTILRERACETVVRDLKELGYTGTAIHNNTGTFYERDKVFAQLGFDNFVPIEYMNDVEYNPIGWAKDNVLTNEIIKALDSTQSRDFVFTITVQGHGKYQRGVDSEEVEDLNIVWGDDPEDEEAFAYYLTQLSETDKFIGDLIDALSRRNEPTMVVFYGDHLPNFNIGSQQLQNGDIFQTEYVYWTNFDTEKKDENLSAYQLSAKVLGDMGLKGGLLTRYHQQMSDSEDYIDGLRLLEYDMLYGKFYCMGGSNPYTATQLRMGVTPVTVTDTSFKDGILTVHGSGFTPWSRVAIEDSVFETVFVDSETVTVALDEPPEAGSVISVRQVAARGDVLSESVGIFWR